MSNPAGAYKLSLTGELSIFTAAATRDQLLAALNDHAEVEVNLAQIAEIDSAGIQLMLAAKKEAAAQKKALRFTCHSASVVDALDLTDLTGHLGDPVLLQA